MIPPIVSVIIALYNKENYIAQALESIIAQTYKNYEIIVVDDGSTDASRTTLEPYMGKITYVWQENAGPGAARNRGICASSGQYIAFLDADDYWLKEFLEYTVSFLEKHPDIGAVATAYWRKRREGKLRWPLGKYRLTEGPIEDFFKTYAKTQFCWTSSVLLTRDVLALLGGFRTDLKVGEDVELWCRVGAVNKWGYISKPLAVYNEMNFDSLTRGENRFSLISDLWDREKAILPLLSQDKKRSYQYVRWMLAWDQFKRLLYLGSYKKFRMHARTYRHKFGFLRGIFLTLFVIFPTVFLKLLHLGYHLYLGIKHQGWPTKAKRGKN